MDNNMVCSWLLYYATHDDEVLNSKCIINVHHNPAIKLKLCSAIAYFNCGSALFDNFPSISSGFLGLFDFLINNEGNVMDKMTDEEQKSYVDKLKDYEGFSMRHHIPIIKCLMKAYVCQLAPWERVKRSLDALTIIISVDNVTNVSSFRHIHKTLNVWLKEAALRGFERLSKSCKDISPSQKCTIVNNSCLGSLLVYTMIYYAQTKMTKYIVNLPEMNSNSNQSDLSLGHCQVVISTFADMCDNKDIFPLRVDNLLSKSTDNVSEALTIALIFHWSFGNSLRNLENLLKSSISSSKAVTCNKSPNHRPSQLPINKIGTDSQRCTAFFMNSTKTSVDSLGSIFSKDQSNHYKNHVNGSNKSGTDGDTSPDIFLTPTEEEMPASFIKSVTPPIKLLSYKSSDNILKPISNNGISEPISINLKAEFQKKLLQKQNLNKNKSKVNIVANNETTWFAQSTKNEMVPLTFTPKKNAKSSEILISNDSVQSLTKGQMNEIQIQLSLRRKKIEHEKKGLVQQSERNLETFKQKVFFQALNQKTEIVRRKSLELNKNQLLNDNEESDRSLSMYVTSGKYQEASSLKKLFSKDSLNNEIPSLLENNNEVSLNNTDPEIIVVDPTNNMLTLQCLKSTESAELTKNMDINQTGDFFEEIKYENETLLPIVANDTINNPSLDESSNDNLINLSRKEDSSPSVSCLSSLSNLSSDKNLVTKDEYQKSIELLSTSLTSLQEEIRFLSKQQLCWNRQISEPINRVDLIVEVNKAKSDNNSVAETPTNNGISLTEVTELPKKVVQLSYTNNNDHLNHKESLSIEQICSVDERCHFSLQSNENSPEEALSHKLKPSQRISYCSDTTSSDKTLEHIIDVCRNDSNNKLESVVYDEMMVSISGSVTEDDGVEMALSSESVVVPAVQPLTFLIADDENNSDAMRRKAELLAKREERRLVKLEMLRQKREQDRENRQSATNEELLERELKKKLEQAKRDNLLQKYLDHKHDENILSISLTDRRSSTTTNTPVKSANKSQNHNSKTKNLRQESVENLTLDSPKRNNWFSSMRQTHRVTSSSTSVLNTNVDMGDSIKFGVPLPPQEYLGPKLFGKRKVKTNRSVISNAISHCCLAGSVNIPVKEAVLKELTEADGTHFMILFRDARCQYRSLYVFDLVTEDLNIITGNGPKRITHDMVEKFFKYNSGAKQFNPILSTKHLSPAVDAICIQSIHWNSRPTSQLLSGAVSSVSLPRSKRL